jgi:predicted DNA binding CopG/RHH family protein
MADKLEIPGFASEGEEARWWVAQEDRLAEEFEQAEARGELGRGTAVRRAALPSTTIRLDPGDIALARAQAARKGMRYQTYLKMLLHEALRAGGRTG